MLTGLRKDEDVRWALWLREDDGDSLEGVPEEASTLQLTEKQLGRTCMYVRTPHVVLIVLLYIRLNWHYKCLSRYVGVGNTFSKASCLSTGILLQYTCGQPSESA